MTMMNIKVHISSTSGGSVSARQDPASSHNFSTPPQSPVHHIHRVKLTTSTVDDQSGLDSGFSDGSSPTASLSVEPYHYYYHLICDPSTPNGGTLAICDNFSPEVTFSSSSTTNDDHSTASSNSSAPFDANSKNYKVFQKFNHLEKFPRCFSDIFVDTSDYKSVLSRSRKENKSKKNINFQKGQTKMCNHSYDNIDEFSK